MSGFPYAEEQRALTLVALADSGFSIGEAWLHYFSLGGAVDEYEVEAYLEGLMPMPPLECDVLALAVNELIDGLPPRKRAPFSDDLVRAHTGSDGAA